MAKVEELTLEAFGKKGRVRAYKMHGKLICQEASLLDFAYQVGLKNFQVKDINVAEDALWNSKGSIITAPQRTVIRDKQGNVTKVKDNVSFIRGIRYTVLYQVETPNGQIIIDLGSAGADSSNLEFRRYVPEIASRRARVRTILTAINRKDLSVDIEMPPDFMEEDKKIIERNSNGYCRPEQVSALRTIYKGKEKQRQLLEKYGKDKLKDLTYQEAGQALREGQRRSLEHVLK